MANLKELTIAQLRHGFETAEFSPVDVANDYLAHIEAEDGAINSFLTVTKDLALEQAHAVTKLFAAGEKLHPLAGIPLAIKDAFYLAGYRTTLGSALYKDHISKNDSGVVRRLKKADAVILGKTNTAEFGQSATSENMLGPDVVNPWDYTRTPGGSSGGSAASVAARFAPVAVGSDGGGSVRIPAAFCGVFGLKTTPGLCPDEKGFRGMTDFVSAGPMSSNVADSRILLQALSDKNFERRSVSKLRIAYDPAPEGWPVDPGVAEKVAVVAKKLQDLGHEVTQVSVPVAGWNEIFGPLVLEDEHRERGHFLNSHAYELTRYERASLRAALDLDPQLVLAAQEELPKYRKKIAEFFDSYDIVLTPTTATTSFSLTERPAIIAGETAHKLWGPFPFTSAFNVAGVAAATVPCGLSEGLPVGAQIIAAAGQEQLVLDLSEDLEEALQFNAFAALEKILTGSKVYA